MRLFFKLSLLAVCAVPSFAREAVHTGLDVLIETNFAALKGKRVGLVTNHTAVSSDGRHAADALAACGRLQLTALFGPEHGIRGRREAGESFDAEIDSSTGVPVYSLYGKINKPTPEMLKNVDVLVFDIQDVGARFFTYISTLFYAMEAAAESDIPFVVLDRPNPIGGRIVEGPVLDLANRSFVGIHEIALRHGMTVGELAQLFNGEGWLRGGVRARLTVVKMQSWRRNMLFEETGLRWIKPSPNMISPQTALVYPGMGLIEATNLSEGRGTPHPFEWVGAPWLDPVRIRQQMMESDLKGIRIDTLSFTPVDIPMVATGNNYRDRRCRGLEFTVTDAATFKSVELGFALITAVRRVHPDSLVIHEKRMNRLGGDGAVTRALMDGMSARDIIRLGEKKLKAFAAQRKKYLLY